MPTINIPENYLRNLSKKDQINELNAEVKCVLGASNIHGIGVFALRNIYKGDRCFVTPRIEPRFYTLSFGDLKQLFPEIRELILARWASIVNGSVFMSPNDDASLLMFVNHSSDNYNYDVVSDTALRDIKKGEELLEDYTVMKNWQLAYPDLNQWQNVLTNRADKKLENRSVVFRVKQIIKSILRS